MIHLSGSKPSRKSTTALSFTFSSAPAPSHSQTFSAKKVQKSQETRKNSENICPDIGPEHFQKNPEILAEILKNNSKIARKGKIFENDEDRELFEINQAGRDTKERKNELKQEIEDVVSESQGKIREYMEKIEKDNESSRDHRKSAEKFKESIKKVQEYSEVLKELLSMEIVDFSEDPRMMTIVSSYGEASVKYSLTDSENPEVFIYRILESNIDFPSKYSYLSSNIEFEKKDIISFYLSIMDSLYMNS
jgi:seryl-tRNA synthetase